MWNGRKNTDLKHVKITSKEMRLQCGIPQCVVNFCFLWQRLLWLRKCWTFSYFAAKSLASSAFTGVTGGFTSSRSSKRIVSRRACGDVSYDVISLLASRGNMVLERSSVLLSTVGYWPVVPERTLSWGGEGRWWRHRLMFHDVPAANTGRRS